MPNEKPTESQSSSKDMEVSRWRVRLRRLKRWARYDGRASDGQFDMNDLPDEDPADTTKQEPRRHSLTGDPQRHTIPRESRRYSLPTVNNYMPDAIVVPPVCIPATYRQQDRKRGVRVGGDRVPFTFDGHKRRRGMIRELAAVEEFEPLELIGVPDMRNSMAVVYAYRGRSRRTCSM